MEEGGQGEPDAGEDGSGALRADPGLHAYFGKVQGLLKDAVREQIIGKLVALLVITVVTAGLGEVFALAPLGSD
ncbi:MAG: hypothetical protein U1E63_15965 [Burkholderiales bacterium]